jgi:hypothetical protein
MANKLPVNTVTQLPANALTSASVLGGTAVQSSKADPRFDVDLDATPDWMSRAINDQRAATLNTAASTFVNDWLASGYTLDELLAYVKQRSS